eukprot:TRINITY_DN51318_c0_g1_i1.p1 TRINITY_DN51318_c0_g1~~TRINITY_DN51318_c0_g1_i1.p1  ORF type:complete len:173 (-),score=24.39 TRINITY_DN51318_c0_g1_i1:218-736(-)
MALFFSTTLVAIIVGLARAVDIAFPTTVCGQFEVPGVGPVKAKITLVNECRADMWATVIGFDTSCINQEYAVKEGKFKSVGADTCLRTNLETFNTKGQDAHADIELRQDAGKAEIIIDNHKDPKIMLREGGDCDKMKFVTGLSAISKTTYDRSCSPSQRLLFASVVSGPTMV